MKINKLQNCGKCGYLKMVLSKLARKYTLYYLYAYHVCMYYIITLFNIMLPHLPQSKKYAFKHHWRRFFVGT
jgi:hypothetical protein